VSPDTWIVVRFGRIELLGLGMEDEGGALLIARAQVVVQRARICGQVLVGAELRGVHEDADDHECTFRLRPADDRPVAFVECAHRRDEADAAALGTLGVADLPRLDGANRRDHGRNTSANISSDPSR
jgi:hypothetical protein